MTTIAPTVLPTRTRVLNGARVHAANPWPTLITPWLILFAIFALNVAIWYIIQSNADNLPADAFQNNGGVFWIFVYMIVVAVQAMNQTFRFAVGLGSTRRDYFGGTLAYFFGLSLMYGVGVAVFAALERATDGWGMGGLFFAPGGLADQPIWELGYAFVMVMLMMTLIGAVFGTVFVRWRATGLTWSFVVLGAVIVAAIFVITRADAWAEIGAWFAAQSLVGFGTWSLLISAVCALGGWALIRRATPRD
jgi:hypothetical protein